MKRSRRLRLKKAAKWLKLHADPTMAEYRARFGVDDLCAAIEMNHLGLISEQELEGYWIQAEVKLKRKHPRAELKMPSKRPPKEKKRYRDEESYFGYVEGEAAPELGIAYIAGFTPGGYPYGTTYEQLDEWARIDAMMEQDKDEIDAWVANGGQVESNLKRWTNRRTKQVSLPKNLPRMRKKESSR